MTQINLKQILNQLETLNPEELKQLNQRETGSTWILNLFDPTVNHEIFIAAITQVEIIAAITRRTKGGDITQKVSKKSIINLKKISAKIIKSLKLLKPSFIQERY